MRKAIDPGVIAEVDGHFWTEVRQVMLTNEHIAKINHAIDDRSSCPSETGELTFTFDKISYLAANPDFNRIYPDQTVQMRTILQQMDSS